MAFKVEAQGFTEIGFHLPASLSDTFTIRILIEEAIIEILSQKKTTRAAGFLEIAVFCSVNIFTIEDEFNV